MTIDDSPSASRTRIWKANAAIIHSPIHLVYIKDCLEEYFALNAGTVSDNTVLINI